MSISVSLFSITYKLDDTSIAILTKTKIYFSGLFTRGSTNSLPASSHHHGAVAYPNISSYIQVDRTEAPIQFIWKSPPPEMRMPSIANYQVSFFYMIHVILQNKAHSCYYSNKTIEYYHFKSWATFSSNSLKGAIFTEVKGFLKQKL